MDIIIIDNIRELIKDSGRKQRFVANLAGIPEKQFSDMLNGRKKIEAKDIAAIAAALEVTPNELFGINAQESA